MMLETEGALAWTDRGMRKYTAAGDFASAAFCMEQAVPACPLKRAAASRSVPKDRCLPGPKALLGLGSAASGRSALYIIA